MKPLTKKEMGLLAVFGSLVLLLAAFSVGANSFIKPVAENAHHPLIEAIKATKNLDERVVLYEKLIEETGLLEAQEALYRSGLPFTGETHLLNHTAGDRAFRKYGAAAVLYCKDYFLASCYHGAILNTIATEGINTLPETMKRCWKSGAPVASQCAHALGHGFLAWFGYKDLTQALTACDDMRENSAHFPLFNCHDGVFMENLWAVHEDGTPSPDRWLKDDDPYYPCSDPRIKEKWQGGCWSNQASVMYQRFSGDLKKTADYCGAVSDAQNKETCFNSLARQIHPLTEGSLEKAVSLCNELPEKWRNFCLMTIVNSDYSVGGRQLPYEICHWFDAERKKECYDRLFAVMRTYYPDPEQRKKYCTPIKDAGYRKECRSIVSS